MIVVGVDAGISGAWAAVKDGQLIALDDVPTAGDGTKRMISGVLLADAWARLAEREGPIDRVVIERVGAMPGQGVSSMFRFGFACGVVEGVAGGLNRPVQYVTPQVWKRHFGLSQDKDASRQLAIQMWPELAPLAFKFKHSHGKAEAALIAVWGYRAAQAAGEAA
jgi:crossover junction endodeoxyribonuclease RuvC